MVLSSKECRGLISAEKLVLAFYVVRVEVSNGNFPNPWPVNPIPIIPCAHFLEVQFTAWQLAQQMKSPPWSQVDLSLETTLMYGM